MYHLRIVAPARALRGGARASSKASPSVCNVIFLEGAAQEPEGDVILADVAREDASVILSDLRELGLEEEGSIALEAIDTSLSKGAERAEGAARARLGRGDLGAGGVPDLRGGRALGLLPGVHRAGHADRLGRDLLDSPILIVGAMVVGPEFGPIAGFCVALVETPAQARRAVAGGARASASPLRSRSPTSWRWPSRRPARHRKFSFDDRPSPTRSPTRTSSRSSSRSARAWPGCCR